MPQQFTVEHQKVLANLVWNPSFESGLVPGNTIDCNAEAVQQNPFSGSWSLRTIATAASVDCSYITPTFQMPVEYDKIYWFGLYARTETGSRDCRLDLLLCDVNGQIIETVTLNQSINTTYKHIYNVRKIEDTRIKYAVIRFYTQRSNAAIGNVTFLDAFMLVDDNNFLSLPAYFDGSSTGASWVGVQNNSVSIKPTTSWEALPDVQQISGFVGRQQIADNFEPSRMSVSARYPEGYFNQNYALRVDTQIRVKRTGSANIMWTGRINNVSVQWGKPYNNTSKVGVADLVEIQCEGALAQWGRLQGNNLTVAASDILTQLSAVLAGTNLQYGTTYTAATAPQLGTSQVSDSLSAWLNTACATVGATIKDGSDNNIVGVYGRDWNGTLPVAFSDTTNNSTNQVFDNIVFDSVSSDYFTEIELNTTSFGDIVANTGVAPYRTLRQTTFSASASQATDLANYLLGVFGENGFGISEISCKSEAQNSWALDLGYGWWDIVGYYTTVTFRGTVYRCAVLGSAFTATPSESRFTYYLADIGLIPFLTLNDQYNGILDYNKLGW